MSSFDDLLRQLAYRLWESRGRPIGTPQRDWFDALSLVNAVTETRSNSSAAFFHCFTRKRDDDHALATLRLMLEIGILLTPELLSFYPKPEVTQCRLSLAFIQPHELFRHSQAFGPFAIQMVSYEKLVGTFGASPVWYIPSFIKKDTGADIFEHGNDLVQGLAKLQNWIQSKAPDEDRHEPHRITRLCMRLLYPTHYRDSTALQEIYYLQREWRVIRRESNLDQDGIAGLTEDERQTLMRHDPSFFGGKVKVWSEEAGKMDDVPRVESTFKLRDTFSELVSSILVPRRMLEQVRALKPPVPVIDAEQFEYGFHP